MNGYEQILSLKWYEKYFHYNYFYRLKEIVESSNFPWEYRNFSAKFSDNFYAPEDNSFFHFIHDIYYNNKQVSPFYQELNRIDEVNEKKIIEAKIVCYMGSKEIVKHFPRIDYSFFNKCMILFLNTCNGGLEISNTKIEAIENRVVFLNGNDVYNTYSCTNSKRFMFLKINYYEN